MKNSLTILLLFCVVCQGIAQDPQLFDNEWYVEKVVLDEVEFNFLGGSAYGVISFNTATFNVGHPNCKQGVTNTIIYLGADSFTIEGGPSVLLGKCSQPDDTEFMFRHFSIYHNLDTGASNNPFVYSFEEENDVIMLTITNLDGDQAIYTSEPLGVSQNELSDVVFYPNPAQNIITIKGNEFLENLSISIYDVAGKKILAKSTLSFDTYTLDIASLKVGVYFLELQTTEGAKILEKIVKL